MAVTLTKSYQRISTISLTYGQIRTYAKYSSQNSSTNKTTYQIKSTYYTSQGGGVSFSSATAKLDGTSKGYGYTTMPKGETTIQELSRTLSHNTNGSSPTKSISTSWSATFGGSGSTSASIVAPKINRLATVTSATDMTDEGNPSVSFSNPGGMSLVPYINFYLNGTRVLRLERSKGSYSSPYNWQITDEERTQIRQAYKTVNSSNYNIGFDSYSGSTNTGYSSVGKTITIINANPIFNNFEFEDVNPITLALTGDNSVNVNGYSRITATIPLANKAEAQKQATMSKYRLTCGEVSLDIPYSSSEDVSGSLSNAPNGTYNMYAIDSRSNSTMVTKLASQVINYESIYLDKQSCSFQRDSNQVGHNGVLTLNGTFWNSSFGEVSNTITSVSYKFKKTGDSTWIDGATTITPTVSGNNFSFTGQIASDNQDTTWDLDASYNLQVIIEDELSSTSVDLVLNSAIPTMSFDKNGVGIMCAYDSSLGGSLQVNGERIDASNVYSEDETKIGIYIDGRPIYRKCFYIDNVDSSGSSYTHNISNLDVIIDAYGSWQSKNSGWGSQPLVRIHPSNSTAFSVSICDISSTRFRLMYGTDGTGFNYVFVVLEYTKTTDNEEEES